MNEHNKSMERQAYPSVVSAAESAFIAPYLTLLKEAAPQRDHSLREVINGLGYIVRSGEAWYTVYQETQCWIAAGVFETIADDLRMLLRMTAGHRVVDTLGLLLTLHTTARLEFST